MVVSPLAAVAEIAGRFQFSNDPLHRPLGDPYRRSQVRRPGPRVLGVADVVEAMASHRPYRPANSIDAVLKEIIGNRGNLYDPDVVDACESILRKKKFDFI